MEEVREGWKRLGDKRDEWRLKARDERKGYEVCRK